MKIVCVKKSTKPLKNNIFKFMFILHNTLDFKTIVVHSYYETIFYEN